jgi:hypothetical protein
MIGDDMADLAQVSSQIRFQLSELGARNAHHLFEELCFHLARARLYSNLLPATGPVSAGGDGGRDFETYPTQLTNDSSTGSSFLARAADQPIAFACTLQQQRLPLKVRADVRKCAESTPPFQRMYFLATANLPVAERHKLEAEASAKHGVELTILDGQALTSMLTDPEVFWIAERYLNLPSELYPRVEGETWYTQTRERWRTAPAPTLSYAEYHDIRDASRHAVADETLKPDLTMWLELLGRFEQGDRGRLSRKATYEVLFTHLRGLGTLIGEEARLGHYLAELATLEQPDELEDAHNMLLWTSGAKARGLVSLLPGQLRAWHVAFEERIGELLDAHPMPGYRCRLLELRALHALSWIDQSGSELRVRRALPMLQELMTLIPDVPLFPVDRLRQYLTTYLQLVGDEPALEPVLDVLAPLIGQQRGNAAEAEMARDRAARAWKSGDLLRAAHHAHHAKILWFAEGTLHGTLLCLKLLAELYRRLNLHFAAKYYALAAAYLAYYSEVAEDQALVSDALLQAALSEYEQGAWASFLDLLAPMFMTHNAFSRNVALPHDDDNIEVALSNLMLLRSIARKLGLGAEGYVHAVLEQWELDLEDYFDQPEEIIEQFGQWTDEQFQRAVEEQLHGPPFADFGPQRRVQFAALGITWTAEWPNDSHTTAAAEELLASLQVLLADVAGTELDLLPVEIHLKLDLGEVTQMEPTPLYLPTPSLAVGFQITLPTTSPSEDIGMGLVGLLTWLLAQCSLLPEEEVMPVLGQRLGEGLLNKLYVARPYRQLFRFFQEAEDTQHLGRADLQVEWPALVAAPNASALAWRSGPGPHDDRVDALEAVTARYQRITRLLPLTLPRLATDPAFQATANLLRSEGWKDWHLLTAVANVALNLRSPVRSGPRPSFTGSLTPETGEEVLLPLEEFTLAKLRQHLTLSQAAALKGLNLTYRLPELIPKALDQVLRERYGYWTDDVPHDDPFLSPS